MNISELIPGSTFPLLVTPLDADSTSEALIESLAQSASRWENLLHIHGGLVFRGFDLSGAEGLDRLIRAVGPNPLSYVGGNSPRTKVGDKAYTSTEFPADQRITLHNELSYARSWPARIMFLCATPPASGGATPIASSKRMLDLLPTDLVTRFEERGLIYLQTLAGRPGWGRTWQETFETSDPAVAEAHLRMNQTEFEWIGQDRMKIRYRSNAIERHPVTNERLWFNQAEQWHPSQLQPRLRAVLQRMVTPEDFPHNVMFGDSSPISDEDANTIRRTYWESSIAFPWERGDLMLLDNMLMAHGREPFQGPRKILVAMA